MYKHWHTDTSSAQYWKYQCRRKFSESVIHDILYNVNLNNCFACVQHS